MSNIVLLPFLLGMLGCHEAIEGSNLYADFYADQRTEARVLFEYSSKLLNEKNVKEPINVDSEGHITLKNQYLSDLISSQYPKKYGNGFVYDTNNVKRNLVFNCLESSYLEKMNKESKLSFVIGSYVRYGINNCINSSKPHLENIKNALGEYGYSGLEVKTRCEECTPQGNELCISNDPENIVSQSEEIIKNTEEGLFYNPKWGKRSSLFMQE